VQTEAFIQLKRELKSSRVMTGHGFAAGEFGFLNADATPQGIDAATLLRIAKTSSQRFWPTNFTAHMSGSLCSRLRALFRRPGVSRLDHFSAW